MSLRSKLMTAFVLLAVLPLALLTIASYRSSVRAFRQAVEAEAAGLAGEMGQRMDVVTGEIGRRVERFWDAPSDEAWPVADTTEAAAVAIPAGLAEALGETALLLERVEVMPTTPAPNGKPRAHRSFVLKDSGAPKRPPAPPPPPGPPAASPAPEADPATVVIDLSGALEELKREIAGADANSQRVAAAAWVDVIGRGGPPDGGRGAGPSGGATPVGRRAQASPRAAGRD
jgi:hypothetical protein